MHATYVLPIRRFEPAPAELGDYLAWLSTHVDVIVVDGSPDHVFTEHARTWGSFVRHVAPHLKTPNGKVGGVLTGLDLARHERIIIADDDVRWDDTALERAVSMLDDVDLVRPQNYFSPLPWHARWDTARTLLNRAWGGDWPGTMALRRSALPAGRYRGDVLFENLEMVRTVCSAGGREIAPLDLYVRRQPCNVGHFMRQRVRQAYDEFARPVRLTSMLLVLPALAWASVTHRLKIIAGASALITLIAEFGRRRAGGQEYFPITASLFAPLWVLERGVCAWCAVVARMTRGGVRYGDVVLRDAATSERELRRRHEGRDATPSSRVEDRLEAVPS